MIKEYFLQKKDIISMKSSSRGSQRKYFSEGYWYKEDSTGYEGESEYLVSKLLEYSNVQNFVRYERCLITVEGNTKFGSRSKNFLRDGQTFITFQRLYEIYYGKNLADDILGYYELSDRIKYVTDTMNKITNCDCTVYLQQILSLDMIILNDDRHFHNLGYLQNEDGSFETAPIFDNGRGLLSDVLIYPLDDSFDENKSKVIGCPFSGSLEMQAASVGINFDFDRVKFYEFLNREKNLTDLRFLRAYNTLEKQLGIYYPIK